MKILHLADLHLGKKVNGFSMLEEQKNVIGQAIELIKNEKIKAVIIAGDIFDKPIPQIEALNLFSDFLSAINQFNAKTCIIPGNHDSEERLAHLSGFLYKSNIFIADIQEGKIKKYELDNKTDIFLMPYIHPLFIKKFYPDKTIENTEDAIKALLNDCEIDKNKINILSAHQFVTGKNENLILSDSEKKSAGGIDSIDYKLFKDFNYTALGHLHCPQKIGADNIRYCGSILKYSFSEINQKKNFLVVDILSKDKINYKFFPIKFIHEMKEYKGFIDEFLDKDFYTKVDTNDYIKFILFDEFVLDAKKKLNSIYPNTMLIEFDNSMTKNLNVLNNPVIKKNKTLFDYFSDFYFEQTNLKIDFEKEKIIKDIIAYSNEVDKCAR